MPEGHGPADIDLAGADADGLPLDWLYLPRLVDYRLRQEGIETVAALLNLSLLALTSGEMLRGMAQRDWLVLARMVRRVFHLPNPRAPFRGLTDFPHADDLPCPPRIRAVLGRYGVAGADDLRQWSLRSLLSISTLSTSDVARVIAALRQVADEPPAATTPAPARFPLDELVAELLATLRPRHASVLRWRFGLAGGRPLGTSAIAAQLQVSAPRVRDMERQALRSLVWHRLRPLRKRLLQEVAEQTQLPVAGTPAAYLRAAARTLVIPGEYDVAGAFRLLAAIEDCEGQGREGAVRPAQGPALDPRSGG